MSGIRPVLRTGPRTDADAGDVEDAPEALLISALLESGRFDPEPYMVRDEDVEAWRGLWEFARDYHEKSGTAPPMNLVTRRFPDFDFTTGIDVNWAAAKVREAGAARQIRHSAQRVIAALGEEDLTAVYDILEGIHRPAQLQRQPASIFDASLLAAEEVKPKIEVPYPSLRRVTAGGIGEAELWYLAARLGHGKTWELLGYAAMAAKHGYRVGVGSFEMPASQMVLRALKRLAGRDGELTVALASDDATVRTEAMQTIKERTPGEIAVYDPSHGAINNVGAIKDMCAQYDLVIADHVGLMVNAGGKRAIEDWRVMAEISNTLREITLATRTPILAAAQINRSGESSGSMRPPGADKLAQSDALGQDADVVVIMKRLAQRVMVQSAEKVRNGPNARWYTRFDPARNRFEEMSKEAANELAEIDGDSAD